MMRTLLTAAVALAVLAASPAGLRNARDSQDRARLEKIAADWSEEAGKKPDDAQAQYRVAEAYSALATVALELKDRNQARLAAEAGIRAAEKAVALAPGNAEYHRMLGTLCGQVIPANLLAGLKYGRCAMDSINTALKLNPKSALAYVSRGIGNYYLPPAMGGGVELAVQDFEKASALDPKLDEAQLWLGIALRKAGRNAEARKAFERSLQLNPQRAFARQQLEKTPAN